MWQCWHIQGQQDAQEILGEQGLLQWLSLQGCFTAQGCGNPLVLSAGQHLPPAAAF